MGLTSPLLLHQISPHLSWRLDIRGINWCFISTSCFPTPWYCMFSILPSWTQMLCFLLSSVQHVASLRTLLFWYLVFYHNISAMVSFVFNHCHSLEGSSLSSYYYGCHLSSSGRLRYLESVSSISPLLSTRVSGVSPSALVFSSSCVSLVFLPSLGQQDGIFFAPESGHRALSSTSGTFFYSSPVACSSLNSASGHLYIQASRLL